MYVREQDKEEVVYVRGQGVQGKSLYFLFYCEPKTKKRKKKKKEKRRFCERKTDKGRNTLGALLREKRQGIR